MGTRADFYVGKHETAEWLGSIAWDGYRQGIPDPILKAKSEDDFRMEVEKFFAQRDDVTRPDQGWPWPWDDSGTTDCSYWFADGQVWDVHGYPGTYYVPADQEPVHNEDGTLDDGMYEAVRFPDMNGKRGKMPLGSARSGLLVFGRRG